MNKKITPIITLSQILMNVRLTMADADSDVTTWLVDTYASVTMLTSSVLKVTSVTQKLICATVSSTIFIVAF